jgi:hypothetical protein
MILSRIDIPKSELTTMFIRPPHRLPDLSNQIVDQTYFPAFELELELEALLSL